METKNREKLLLIATGVVAGLWLVNLLIISPLIDSWRSRSQEIVKLKKNISDGVMVVRRESSIRDRWDTMRGHALANNPTAAERQLFTAFDHWVNSAGVTEGSFRPQLQEGDTNYSTVDCRSDVSGAPQNMQDFVKAMSKDPLADKIDSFELTTKDDNGRQLTLGLGLSGLVLTDSDPSSIQLPAEPPAPAPSTDTNVPEANPAVDLFKLIARNNIFDQSRTPRDDPNRRVRTTPKVETISCNGSVFDHGLGSAWFAGTDVSDTKEYKVGDSVGDFKIARISLATIMLTNTTTNFVIGVGGNPSLRREDNGDWHHSGYIASEATPETVPTPSTSPAPAAGSGANSILEMLKKRREQEEK